MMLAISLTVLVAKERIPVNCPATAATAFKRPAIATISTTAFNKH